MQDRRRRSSHGCCSTAGPAVAQSPPWLKIENGATQPQFDLADAIEETLFVETSRHRPRRPRDRVRIRISRPRETDTQGIKVPVIFEHSPYRYNIGGGANHNVDFDGCPRRGIATPQRRAAATRAGPGGKPNLPG